MSKKTKEMDWRFGDRLCETLPERLFIDAIGDIRMSASIEMPKYKCHKEVWALKIKKVYFDTHPELSNGDAWLVFEEDGYADKLVSREYVEKHEPKEGGYYVVYEGGYESFSPADAFESGIH